MSQFKAGDKVSALADGMICGTVQRAGRWNALVTWDVPEGGFGGLFCNCELEKLPEKEEAARFVVDDQEKRQVKQELVALKGGIKALADLCKAKADACIDKAREMDKAGHEAGAYNERDQAITYFEVANACERLLY